ncbi:MAG: hypothetical protein WDN00_09600 [Limisphaerales bacterium]
MRPSGQMQRISLLKQARIHFLNAQALAAEGKSTAALNEFIQARDPRHDALASHFSGG